MPDNFLWLQGLKPISSAEASGMEPRVKPQMAAQEKGGFSRVPVCWGGRSAFQGNKDNLPCLSLLRIKALLAALVPYCLSCTRLSIICVCERLAVAQASPLRSEELRDENQGAGQRGRTPLIFPLPCSTIFALI